MRPRVNASASSAPPLSGFRNFLVAILRNRILLLFLLVAALTFSLRWIDPGLILPQVIYFGFVLIGFLWSAFRAYRDLSAAYRNILEPALEAAVSRSMLTVAPVTGNEYSYSIGDPYAGQNLYITRMQKTKGAQCRFDGRGVFYINDTIFYCMSTAALVINLHMENSGELPLDVLAMRLENSLDLNYLKFTKDEVTLYGKKLGFPFHLQAGEFIVLQCSYEITAGKDANNALFAADFQALPRSIVHEIAFDTQDVNGSKQTYISKIETPTKPLIDLYVKQWREYDQQEYLFLAGHASLAVT